MNGNFGRRAIQTPRASVRNNPMPERLVGSARCQSAAPSALMPIVGPLVSIPAATPLSRGIGPVVRKGSADVWGELGGVQNRPPSAAGSGLFRSSIQRAPNCTDLARGLARGGLLGVSWSTSRGRVL